MSSSDQDGLPEGWEMCTSPGGSVVYYINKNIRRNQWPKPSAPIPKPDTHASVPEEVRCSHILIKHIESRRPASWRSDNIRRTKEEAFGIISDFRQQIMNREAKFEDIAKVFSDCSSAKRQGDLGTFQKGQMQKAFEVVAFKLKVGQVSKIFETKSGFHLILRTG